MSLPKVVLPFVSADMVSRQRILLQGLTNESTSSFVKGSGAKPVEEIDPVHQASAMVVAKDMTHLIGKNFVNIFT